MVALALAATTGSAVGYAQSPTDRVVVTVGEGSIRLGEVQRRLAQVPPFQLQAMGKSPEAIKQRFVDELISLELLVQGARNAKLDELPEVRERIRSVLASAVLQDLRKGAEESSVSAADVKVYYDEHRDRYKSELRIKLWQITVKTRADADKLLGIIKSDPDYKKDPTAGWDKLAREHSIDKSTKKRKGNLGFVHPDGTTAHKDLRVPKELYDAAAKIANGEVCPEPIEAGSYWVVLQRRGSHITPERTLEMETRVIRKVLVKSLEKQRTNELLEQLRTKHVSEKQPKLIDQIVISNDGELTGVQRRPGSLRRHPARGPQKPSGRPGRLR